MSDVIQLLPDNVANQIAAGEVVQRPASVVKELIENAIDAGADSIQLIVKEAGRTLIQVIDNGKGMSVTDARMSLERHATSKIQKAEDLFHIRTMGFRGEALASIVAVAQCEVKTKLHTEDIGTHIIVEGSKVLSQEACTTESGTHISVKNLFFNIPARRKFLKSNAVENRHIVDQFERIALIYPDIKFEMYQDGTRMFHLPAASLRQRIVGIFGKKFDNRLVPIQEETSLVKLSGFVCKPEFAKKKRDGQFLFVNQRFIKSNYLHHGILSAFEQLIPPGSHPTYFIHLECDPEQIDVNIHPTKTEVKFQEERSIYAIIRSSVRKALGEHNIAPSLDFNRETAFDGIDPKQEVVLPQIPVNPEFNPFDKSPSSGSSSGSIAYSKESNSGGGRWEQLISPSQEVVQQQVDFEPVQSEFIIQPSGATHSENEGEKQKSFIQFKGKYLITPLKSGLVVIHIRRAFERISYERNLQAFALNQGMSQQSLFPVTLDFKPDEAQMLKGLLPEMELLGFNIEEFGQNTFIVRGLPVEVADQESGNLIEEILGNFRENEQNLELKSHTNLALSLARRESVHMARKLKNEECSALVDQLFGCENPHLTATGKSIFSQLSEADLESRFA